MPIDKVEQAKQYIELAKMSQASFHNRRDYEWRVAFGFWGLMAAATYLLIDKKVLVLSGNSVGWLLLALILLLGAWFFLWQFPNRAAFDDDNAIKIFYMKSAEAVLAGKVFKLKRPVRSTPSDMFARWLPMVIIKSLFGLCSAQLSAAPQSWK